MKKWKDHPAQCLYCGGNSEIYTYEDLDDGWGYDGDPMRCIECGCPGQWIVYAEDDAYADWHDDLNCKCDWCTRHFDSEMGIEHEPKKM